MPPCVLFSTAAAAFTPSTAAVPLMAYGPVVPVSMTMTNGDEADPPAPDPPLLQAASAATESRTSSRDARLAGLLTWRIETPLPPRYWAASSRRRTPEGEYVRAPAQPARCALCRASPADAGRIPRAVLRPHVRDITSRPPAKQAMIQSL